MLQADGVRLAGKAISEVPAMRHGITPPVELTSAKQLPGRFVRITSAKALDLSAA
jgi:hypothetical protein